MMKFQVVRYEQNHMATTFDFRVSCLAEEAGLAERALQECQARVAVLERELSEFLPESPVYRLNHAPVHQRIRFSKSAFDLLIRSFELRKKSESAFNPLAKSRCVEPRLGWDARTRGVWRETEETHLGFGAIGKGYALDQVREIIDAFGFQNYLLCAGGSSIILSGHESPGNPWKWGWSWKKDEDGNSLGFKLSHETGHAIALGISGTHEKGQHLIGARTGLKSALVATPSAADADALSTALFVSGWEKSKSFLTDLPLAPATAWVDESDVPHWNGVFQNLWSAAKLFAALFAFHSLWAARAFCDEGIDLSSLNDAKNSFTPYVFDRSFAWILLPIFGFLLVSSHLKKTKPLRDRKKLMNKNLTSNLGVLVLAGLWATIEISNAVEIEPMGKAIASLLGTTKAFKRVLNDGQGNVDVFYSKGANGKAQRAVVIEKGLYPTDCTHTWAIGIDVATQKVTEVRPLEMACPHAYPTKSASFLDQYKGKGPADVAKLDGDIHVVAKATGTSKLATDAVKRSIVAISKAKGQF